MGVIKVNGIKLYAYHGCMSEEARIGTNYIVDVMVHTNLIPSSESDELKDTTDYVSINKIVQNQMMIRSKLIEVVCRRILDKILDIHPEVQLAEVTITKMHPPINGDVDSVSVTMEVKR